MPHSKPDTAGQFATVLSHDRLALDFEKNQRQYHIGSVVFKVTSFALFAFVACSTFALEGVVFVQSDASRTILARILRTLEICKYNTILIKVKS